MRSVVLISINVPSRLIINQLYFLYYQLMSAISGRTRRNTCRCPTVANSCLQEEFIGGLPVEIAQVIRKNNRLTCSQLDQLEVLQPSNCLYAAVQQMERALQWQQGRLELQTQERRLSPTADNGQLSKPQVKLQEKRCMDMLLPEQMEEQMPWPFRSFSNASNLSSEPHA